MSVDPLAKIKKLEDITIEVIDSARPTLSYVFWMAK
jgi:hypothetical protein